VQRNLLGRLRRPWALVPLALFLLMIAAAVLLLNQSWVQAALVRALSGHIHHDIRVHGAFSVRLLSRHPTIVATGVTITNPSWGPPGQMATIGRVELALKWRAGLFPFEIRRMELDAATWQLFRNSQGRANWYVEPTGPGSGPPMIQSLSMRNAHVKLQDFRRHVSFNGTVSAADVETTVGTEGAAPLRIEGSGKLNGRMAVFRVDAEALATARLGRPLHFTLWEQSQEARLVGEGYLDHAFDFRFLHGRFQASGPSMADLYYLVGLTLPHTGSFDLRGTITREGTRTIYDALDAHSGSSDLGGTLSIDGSRDRSRIVGELSSHSFNISDLRAAAAAPKKADPARSPEKQMRLPDADLHRSGLRRLDASIGLRFQELVLGSAQLQAVSSTLSLDNGLLTVAPFQGHVADGTFSGTGRLDVRAQMAHGELTLDATALPLEQLLPHRSVLVFNGPLTARARFEDHGTSWHDLLASTNGHVAAVLTHGGMTAAAAELISLNVTGALGSLFSHQKQTAIDCGVVGIAARNGELTVQTLAIDTDRALILGTGGVNLASGSVALTLRGQLKHGGLALRSAIEIRGLLAHPQFKLSKPEGLSLRAKEGARVVVPASLASQLSSLDPSLMSHSSCGQVLAPQS
jgi:uncharacterized protein involved in outer membrane biogenesis